MTQLKTNENTMKMGGGHIITEDISNYNCFKYHANP